MRTVPKTFTRQELRLLMHAADPLVRALMVILLESGLRSAEVRSITKEEALSWPRRGHHAIVIRGKGAGSMHEGGGKERVVLLSPRALKAAHRLALASGNGAMVPWEERTMRRRLEELGRKAGIDSVHAHRFRHTLAQRLIETGSSLQEVADILGHENLQTARIYAESSIVMRRRALRRRRWSLWRS